MTRGAQLLAVGDVNVALGEAADLYAVLGVDPSAERRDIRRAYMALAKEYHPDRFQARGGAGDDGRAFVALSEVARPRRKRRRVRGGRGALSNAAPTNRSDVGRARGAASNAAPAQAYATLADANKRRAYDAARCHRGGCRDLDDVVTLIRETAGPARLRFLGRVAERPPPPPKKPRDKAAEEATGDVRRSTCWLGAVARRAAAGDADALYKLGVGYALFQSTESVGAARCFAAAERRGDARAAASARVLRDASAAEARRAAYAAPLARAALDGDAEAGLLVGIALLRVDAAAERAKALAPARARTRSSRRRALVRGGGRFADAPEHSQK